ncbi:MAG: hypothetical protein KKA32_14120 [Actinobacteria bacterium]|nr:hypothetical protein [Actinomycetota bacterium]
MNRRIVVILLGTVAILLFLPLVVAERYTSPTQDGQYVGNPFRAYRFVFAAATVSPSSELNTSGEALDRAKTLFADTDLRPNRVELLFLGGVEDYRYTTIDGNDLYVGEPETFIWEVWGVAADDDSKSDVIALLDYRTGQLLASIQ